MCAWQGARKGTGALIKERCGNSQVGTELPSDAPMQHLQFLKGCFKYVFRLVHFGKQMAILSRAGRHESGFWCCWCVIWTTRFACGVSPVVSLIPADGPVMVEYTLFFPNLLNPACLA